MTLNRSDDISEKSDAIAVHYSLTTFHSSLDSLAFVPNFSSYLVQHIVAKVYQILISGASPKLLKLVSTLVDKGTTMNTAPRLTFISDESLWTNLYAMQQSIP